MRLKNWAASWRGDGTRSFTGRSPKPSFLLCLLAPPVRSVSAIQDSAGAACPASEPSKWDLISPRPTCESLSGAFILFVPQRHAWRRKGSVPLSKTPPPFSGFQPVRSLLEATSRGQKAYSVYPILLFPTDSDHTRAYRRHRQLTLATQTLRRPRQGALPQITANRFGRRGNLGVAFALAIAPSAQAGCSTSNPSWSVRFTYTNLETVISCVSSQLINQVFFAIDTRPRERFATMNPPRHPTSTLGDLVASRRLRLAGRTANREQIAALTMAPSFF